jgi:hypothetical protein
MYTDSVNNVPESNTQKKNQELQNEREADFVVF